MAFVIATLSYRGELKISSKCKLSQLFLPSRRMLQLPVTISRQNALAPSSHPAVPRKVVAVNCPNVSRSMPGAKRRLAHPSVSFGLLDSGSLAGNFGR